MVKDLKIEPLSIGQAGDIAKIHLASFNDNAWTFEQLRNTFNLQTTQGLVAFTGNEIVGFVLYQSTGLEAEVLTFCVHPKAQRQKIGEQLLLQTVASLSAEGTERLFLEVAADNTPAVSLYQKLGFKIMGRRPGYYERGNQRIDALTFELALFAS